ncbi:MAG: hypothetical protein R3F61_25835 [Myxococcota bacterium]
MTLIALSLLTGAAEARSFNAASIPYTTTLDFTWDAPISASGSTTFTMTNITTTVTSTQICRDTNGCLNGDFLTGNGGTGDYRIRVSFDFFDDCVATGVQVPIGGSGQYRQKYTCDLYQSMELRYHDTEARYLGEAYTGTVDIDFRFADAMATTPNQARNYRNYVYVVAPFTGSIAASNIYGSFTGSFDEPVP